VVLRTGEVGYGEMLENVRYECTTDGTKVHSVRPGQTILGEGG